MDEFARSFMQADRLYVLDIYAASEQPIEGVTSQALVERIRQFGHRAVEYAESMSAAVDAVVGSVEAGDLVLTLGAGSVWQAGDLVLGQLNPDAATRGRGDTAAGKREGETGRGGEGETKTDAARHGESRK
jgi:UDP-N-acetylmuramate--alanine ligase